MALALVIFIAWIVLAVFAIVPKRLSLLDMIFLYFITVILTTSLLTLLDINLHALVVSKRVEKSFAAIITRMITYPLSLIMSANVFRSSLKAKYKWSIACTALLLLTAYDWCLTFLGVKTYRHWNVLYAFLLFSLFMTVINFIAWWFVNLGRKEVQAGDRL